MPGLMAEDCLNPQGGIIPKNEKPHSLLNFFMRTGELLQPGAMRLSSGLCSPDLPQGHDHRPVGQASNGSLNPVD
jgi:hypothetical protein